MSPPSHTEWGVSADIDLPADRELRFPLAAIPPGKRYIFTCLELAYYGQCPITVALELGEPPNAVPAAWFPVQAGGVPGIRAGEAAPRPICGPLAASLVFPPAGEAARATIRIAGRLEGMVAAQVLQQRLTAVAAGANELPEGPIPPDKFQWQGRQVDGLSLYQWQFLNALCDASQLRRAVPIREVINRVYGQQAADNDDRRRALEQVRRRTQTKLDAAGIPLLIDLTNQSYRLTPI